MKSIIVMLMAVVIVMAFSMSLFAGDKDEKKDEKKGGKVLLFDAKKK